MKNVYIITVTDTATYAIKSASREMAEDLAVEYFSERNPSIKVEISNNEEPEVEI